MVRVPYGIRQALPVRGLVIYVTIRCAKLRCRGKIAVLVEFCSSGLDDRPTPTITAALIPHGIETLELVSTSRLTAGELVGSQQFL